VNGSSSVIPTLLREGDADTAATVAIRALDETFGLDVVGIVFTQDEYSLNSVSGRARLRSGKEYFFKFHQEEGELDNVQEYYRAHLLADAGLPTEVPVATSTLPGAQMVLYAIRTEPRLADVCARLEREHGEDARLPPPLLAARRALDERIGDVLVATVREPSGASATASIHQLFHHRLVDDDGHFPGGRYATYYAGDPDIAPLLDRRWRVNGVEYEHSPTEIARQAARVLRPGELALMHEATAHGDDHQGNVWVLGEESGGVTLRLFDPAFAGDDLPVLLAPVKALFHNVFAHPFWLYHPGEAELRSTVSTRVDDRVVEVVHDIRLTRLRREILASAEELIWAPLLRELARRGALPEQWRRIVRSALFCCPMLVTNLAAPNRSVPIRHLGVASSVAMGSEPVAGTDALSDFLDRITP